MSEKLYIHIILCLENKETAGIPGGSRLVGSQQFAWRTHDKTFKARSSPML